MDARLCSAKGNGTKGTSNEDEREADLACDLLDTVWLQARHSADACAVMEEEVVAVQEVQNPPTIRKIGVEGVMMVAVSEL